MKKWEVYEMFYDVINGTRSEIRYSKGYKVFDEVYDELKEKYSLIRTEYYDGTELVKIERGE